MKANKRIFLKQLKQGLSNLSEKDFYTKHKNHHSRSENVKDADLESRISKSYFPALTEIFGD